MRKKLLSILLTLALLLSLIPAGYAADIEIEDGQEENITIDEPETAEEPAQLPPANGMNNNVARGECGDDLTWTLDDEGTLTITGTGEMWDYGMEIQPGWSESADSICALVIEDGATSIGDYAFRFCSNMLDVTIPETMERIERFSFSSCRRMTSLTLPDGLIGIGEGAFNDCSSLTIIEIPESVMSIGESAFRYCGNLLFITIPKGVTSIEDYTFYNCGMLRSVSMPNGLKSIGVHAFEACYNLTSVIIPSSVTSFEAFAFSNCSKLAEIRFEGAAPTFADNCFSGVTATAYYPANDPSWTEEVRQDYGGTITWVAYAPEPIIIASGQCGDNLYWTLDDQGTLTITGTGDMWSSPGGINWDGHKNDIISVVIEDGATSIGIEAFRKCTNLTSAVIPGSVVYIDTQAFDSCSSLSSVTLSEGLQEIGMYVFYNCSSLTSIRLPESVSDLALCSFASCTALREVQLSSQLTSIPIGCFGGCSSLTSAEIPDGVTSIQDAAFRDCASLTEVLLPDGVTSIGSQAFADCASVTKLVIPASVSEIGELAFNGCTGLKTAGLSGSGKDIEFGWTQTIPANAFSGCSNLAEAELPDSLTAIGPTAFANCALTEVTFPAGVTDIGSGAYDGCASLAVVRIPKNTVGIGSSAFRGCTGLTDVYYGGYEEEAAHNKSAGWSTIENAPLFSAVWHYAMRPEEGWALCGPELFYRYDAESGTLSIKGSGPMWDFKLIGTTPTHPWVDCNSDIVSISLEPGVTHIGAYAFYICKGLTSVTVPEGVTSIGDHAFHYCNTMTGAVLPESLTSIGAGAFSYCEKLLDCAIPAGVTEIGTAAFANCYALQRLVIPEGIERIERLSFWYCRSLTEVTIPESVTVIGEGAFGACYNLTAIRFEGSAPVFPENCFENVTATAYYPANDPSWTESVMQNYGGTITWVPYGEAADEFTITLTDYTNGAAQTSLDFGAKYSGELSFTVSADSAVVVAVKKGEEYTPIKCSTVDGEHRFTLTVTEDTELVFAFRGDADLNGKVNLRDAKAIKGHVADDLDPPLTPIAVLAANANSDRKVNLRDAQFIKAVVAGDEEIAW